MATRSGLSFAMRPLAGDDIEQLAAWFQDFEDLAMFDRSGTIPVGPEAVAKLWREDLDSAPPRKSYWYIAENDAGDALGICGIEGINYVHGDGILPLFVSKAMRGKGVGLELGARVLNLAFDSLRLRRISTFYRADNTATAGLIDKLGFAIEGTLRKAWFHKGDHVDIVVAGILCEDWATRRASLPDLATMDGRLRYNPGVH